MSAQIKAQQDALKAEREAEQLSTKRFRNETSRRRSKKTTKKKTWQSKFDHT